MPRVVVLGGINGAGKTTASRAVLTDVLKIPTFVNADAIARGLNGLNPDAESFRAGRLKLQEMARPVEARADFAFETTLSARTYAGWLSKLRVLVYETHLFYYWLRSPELAISRVAARVKSGGTSGGGMPGASETSSSCIGLSRITGKCTITRMTTAICSRWASMAKKKLTTGSIGPNS